MQDKDTDTHSAKSRVGEKKKKKRWKCSFYQPGFYCARFSPADAVSLQQAWRTFALVLHV